MIIQSRRALLGGLVGLIVAPAIVRVGSLMKMPRAPVGLGTLHMGGKAIGRVLSMDLYPDGMVITKFAFFKEMTFPEFLYSELDILSVSLSDDSVRHRGEMKQHMSRVFHRPGDLISLKDIS